MFRLAVKSVKHNPKRLILTAVAVALGVALASATFTLTNALSGGFHQLFDEIYSGTDVIVETAPTPGGGTGDPFAIPDPVFTSEDIDTIAAVDGVAAAVGDIQVSGSILAADFEPTGEISDAAGGVQSQIHTWYGDPKVDGATLIEGHGPESDDQIVLDRMKQMGH